MTRNQIIENLFTGKNFNDCVSKMEPAHLQEDLKMEVISIVCEWPDDKVIKLYEDKALEFFVVRVILNQVKSKTSPFTKKYRAPVIPIFSNPLERDDNGSEVLYGFLSKAVNNPQMTDEEEMNERAMWEQLQDIAMEEIDMLYWYDAELIRLYLKLGSFRAIEEETGIPFISCYKNIQKSLATLKSIAFKKAAPLFSKEELAFIQNNKV